MKINKKSKYYRDGYNNPMRCAETVVRAGTKTEVQPKWILEMSEGVKNAQIDKANGNYKFI